MIIKNTVQQDYELLRFHVTQLIEQLEKLNVYDDADEYPAAIDTADTVAEAFDALDRKLKDGGAFPSEWTKNR